MLVVLCTIYVMSIDEISLKFIKMGFYFNYTNPD